MMEEFAAALENLWLEVKRAVEEDWPLLLIVYAAICFLVLGAHAAGLLP